MSLARVMLVDDDSFIRATLSAALSGYGVNVVGDAGNASEAMHILRKGQPEVAVVDLDLGPGPSGIDICHALRNQQAQLGLILLTSYTDVRVFDPQSSQLPKGTRFLSKGEVTDVRNLVQEILIVRNKPLSDRRSANRSSRELTDVQLEVLKMVAEGLSTLEIAEKRGVSVKAIDAIISKTNISLGIEKSKSLNQRVQLARAYFRLAGKKPPGV